jgi:nucleolar protein 56
MKPNCLLFFSACPGVLPEDLKVFLENNLPKSTKKLKVTLGVSEAKLAAAISDELGAECVCSGAIPELMRGTRSVCVA